MGEGERKEDKKERCGQAVQLDGDETQHLSAREINMVLWYGTEICHVDTHAHTPTITHIRMASVYPALPCPRLYLGEDKQKCEGPRTNTEVVYVCVGSRHPSLLPLPPSSVSQCPLHLPPSQTPAGAAVRFQTDTKGMTQYPL